MRRYIISILIALLTLPVFAQQQTQAKAVLDKTAAAFEKAGGVKAGFSLEAFNKGRSLGTATGVIELKGEKFFLKTPESVSWFDGKTQWTYQPANDEVTVTTPTQAELQSMNPYALLYLYKKGFSYRLGALKTYKGKQVNEVVLTATDKKQDLSGIVLYVAKDTFQPLFIKVELRDKTYNEIVITSYQTGLNLPDASFAFNKKQYPTAEIIDLR